jgi:tetratricopeptide (TPR) repeat protein
MKEPKDPVFNFDVRLNISLVRNLVAPLIALAACQPLARAQASFEYESDLQKARSCLEAGKPDDALANAERAMSLDFTRWEAYAIAGEMFMKLNRFHDAENSFDRAIERAPSNSQGILRDLLSKCLVEDSSSIASSLAKAASQMHVAVSKSTSGNSELENRARAADIHAAQDTAVRRASNEEIPTVFDVGFASNRGGVFESTGQLTVRPGGLDYVALNPTQSFTLSASEIVDVSSLVRESRAAPSFRASGAEAVLVHVSGKGEMFFENRKGNADNADSNDSLFDALRRLSR